MRRLSVYIWPGQNVSSVRYSRQRDTAPPLPGPRAIRGDSEVIARARRALANGPLDDDALLSHALALPGAPPGVACRVAEALFARQDGIARDSDGRWILCEVASDDGAQPLRTIRFAVVDVETTGGAASRGHRITEVAVVPVVGGAHLEPWSTLVNPARPMAHGVVALTGITPAMVATAPLFSGVADAVVERLRGHVFVAHNAAFDWGFVGHELRSSNGTSLVGDRLCTLKLARVFLPQLKRRSLDALTYYFGIENPGRHRAWGDALATASVLTRLLAVAEDQGIDTWPALTARLDRRTGKARRRRRALPQFVDYDTSA